MSEQEKIRTRMVYLGLSEGGKNKVFHAWARIPLKLPLEMLAQAEVKLNDVLHFGGKNLAKGRPGIVYDFDVEYGEDGHASILGPNRDFVALWPKQKDRAEWQTQTEAIKAARAARNKQNQTLGRNAIFDSLEPIRDAYFRASPTAKRMILAYVIARITTLTGKL